MLRFQMGRRDPGSDRVPGLLGELKLHRSLRLLLHDNRSRGDIAALEHIANPKPNQIATAQPAIDS
jgi:hypothetical protein